jgi:UDP-glucose:(heptosyl)LPS alpha-1,3-glucosyltransferase
VKIALVHMRHAGTGGTERYLNQLAAHLARRGDEVDVVCRSHEAPPHPAVRFVRLHGAAIGAGWRMVAFARSVERYLRGARYDVVYGLGRTWSQDVVRLGGGCYETWLERTRPESTLDRVVALASSKQRLAPKIERRALAPGAYRRVVVNSAMVGRDVTGRYAVPNEALRLVYNGADVERFHPRLREGPGGALRASLGWGRAERVLLFLGTGYARKGLAPLIDAFAAVSRRDRAARLLVVGYDSTRARYEERAARHGLGERVRFLGGRRDTEACFAAADLYALPTRYDPFANTTIEALASGLPVITSADNGGSELLTPGVHGSVLGQGWRVEDLAREIEGWLDPERAREGGERARELALRHSADAKTAESAAVLDEVAG